METAKAEKALHCIETIIDAWYNDRLVIVGNNEECDLSHGECIIDSVMGMISNHVYEGLGKDVPVPKYIMRK